MKNRIIFGLNQKIFTIVPKRILKIIKKKSCHSSSHVNIYACILITKNKELLFPQKFSSLFFGFFIIQNAYNFSITLNGRHSSGHLSNREWAKQKFNTKVTIFIIAHAHAMLSSVSGFRFYPRAFLPVGAIFFFHSAHLFLPTSAEVVYLNSTQKFICYAKSLQMISAKKKYFFSEKKK